ncbi:MAG: DUF4331 domain-containing protein [Pyrinomonadaceae bacterium MAG19_C2-C3]|nr:DUF4331 domain-containing protein [Pyrinomonadaceae bacterium MAG19_C2-C3]
MFSFTRRQLAMIVSLAVIIVVALYFTAHVPIEAADHGDAPIASLDRSADLNDVYALLDPNDNTRVFLAMTSQGFIVPAEAVNFGIFDPSITYRFELEMTGDATPDKFIDIRFSAKTQSPTQAQIATVILPDGRTFTAPNTIPSLAATAPPRVITTHQASGVQFFSGLVDDAFLFDIPGVNRFIASVRAGAPNASFLNRGRDTFAGYNTLAIALSLPIALLQPTANSEIGVNAVTIRNVALRRPTRFQRGASKTLTTQVDRAANPTVNVVLVPFPRKNEHNISTTMDDAAGRFTDSIVATLTALGTRLENINTLAQIAVVRGDFLRLKFDIRNEGPGGGNNPGAGFPNGRRPGDDVVDTLLTVITNGAITTDNANTNDVPFINTFPFFGLPHQPRDTGMDDQTRN